MLFYLIFLFNFILWFLSLLSLSLSFFFMTRCRLTRTFFSCVCVCCVCAIGSLASVNVPLIAPKVADVNAVHEKISLAQRPVILIGSQAVRAKGAKSLVQALENIGAPVFLSGMGRGLLGKEHRLLMKHKRSNALGKADFVMLCGTQKKCADVHEHFTSLVLFCFVWDCFKMLAIRYRIRNHPVISLRLEMSVFAANSERVCDRWAHAYFIK